MCMTTRPCFGGTWKHQRWKWHSKCCYITLKNFVTNCLAKCDITSTNMAITSHSRNGQLDIARKLFNEMPQRTVASWNTMISAYSKCGRFEEALNVLSSMHFNNMKLNETTFCSGLSASARLRSYYAGKQLHGLVLRSALESFHLVGSALLYFYANCYQLEQARRVFNDHHERNGLLWSLMLVCYVQCNLLDDALDVFNKMPARDIVAWTALISGFSKRDGGFEKAFELFCLMKKRCEVEPNEFTLDCVIRACGRFTALLEGKTLHGLTIKYGFEFEHSVCGALIEFYCSCKAIDDGKRAYLGLSNPGMSESNSLIEGLVEGGRIEEAELVFNGLVKKDSTIYNLMINAYSLAGRFEDSIELFLKMPQKVLASMNTMISVYSRNGNLNKALELFEVTKEERNTVTWNSMISGTALVDFYSKCGSITDAQSSFISILNPNVAAWTALLNGYANHGLCSEAILLLENMINQGIKPNGATFVGVLSACAHAGWVNEGMKYLGLMKESYGIEPTMEHFTYAVDFLGQSGYIQEAEEMIKEMPFEPDSVVLGVLLKACWLWSDVEVGERVAQKMVDMDPKSISAYVIMSNLYSGIGRWKDKIKMRQMLKNLDVKKDPGCSWIEVDNNVCVFSVKDGSHPCEIYQQTDSDFLESGKDTFRDDGSTASTAVLVGNHLYVANVGDSRTVISKAGKAIPLSEDHKPNRSDERKRIESAGGVVMWAGTWRVGGVLAMSRAFGNRMLKQFVVAEPEIQEQELDEEFELLVLASDGLWDVVPNEDAVSLALSEEEPESAARKLIETAFSRGSADNITCIVVRLYHEASSATALECKPQPKNQSETEIKVEPQSQPETESKIELETETETETKKGE